MNKTKHIRNIIITVTIALSFISPLQAAQTEKLSYARMSDDTVLATVNGTPVTKFDLEWMIQKTISGRSNQPLDEAARQKVLEAVITARALAMECEPALTEKEKKEIEKKANAYREELLVNLYLTKHIRPERVSQKMIEDYYDAHPEKFGGETIRSCEILFTSPIQQSSERDKMIHELNRIKDAQDWKSHAEQLTQKGILISYRRLESKDAKLDSELERVMQNLKKGETSSLVFIKKAAYLMRVVDETVKPPLPLAAVKMKIKTMLEPIQIKNAVKAVSDSVLNKTDVTYE